MDWQDVYTISSTEKVQELEDQLGNDLKELQEEIEESETTFSMPTRYRSTIPIPKSVKHYRRERKTIFKRALNVSQAHPTALQSHIMWHEQNNADRCEYTQDSLPLLLHQYFLDRVHQLVVLKHMHMLRWKRFCKNSKVIENLYPTFNHRLSEIMSEYSDCVSRCQRLSVAKEAHMAKTDEGVMAITVDDMLIYLRHLICNLHSIKNFTNYLKVLEWLPVSHHKYFENRGNSTAEPEYSKLISTFNADESFDIESKHDASKSTYDPLRPTENSRRLSHLGASLSPSSAVAPVPSVKVSDEMSRDFCVHPLAVDHLPVSNNDIESIKPQLSQLLKLYNVPVDVSTLGSSADEMELYATVCKKFRSVFTRQETMRTFKTYDSTEAGLDTLGVDSPVYSLKQESNWLPYVSLKPEQNPFYEKKMTDFKQNKRYDEILRVKMYFLKCKDQEQVLSSLKQHAVFVRDPPAFQNPSQAKAQQGSVIMWRKIYSYSDKELVNCVDEKSGKSGKSKETDKPKAANNRNRKSSYDYKNTVQMLGLDDGEHDRDDPESLQGGYLSYLMLRYLRIRDLQRTTLSILNYFRSIERSLTINDGGLSLDSNRVSRSSSQNHRYGMSSGGTVGGGGGLGSHAYLHNTPIDFKIEETEFMSYTEIENHDDFFTIEDGRVHVQDLRGYYIMYDSAIDDFTKLENDLLLLASNYINNDKKMRSNIKSKKSHLKSSQSDGGWENSLQSYGHQEIDRFSILLDVWSNETAFLEAKKHLLDCYLEAYHHICDRDEKRAMAQVITNVMHKRPRFDFGAPYFVKIYRGECINMKLQADLLKAVLDKQIEDDRAYDQRICRHSNPPQGLPYKLIHKQPIAINMSHASPEIAPRPALKSVFLMEFHPSLAIASKLPAALDVIFHELEHTYRPSTMLETVMLERKLLELSITSLSAMLVPGSLHSPIIQKDLFGDVFVEDPMFMTEIAKSLLEEIYQQKLTKKEKQTMVVESVASLMEIVTIRFRFLNAVYETEILSKMYQPFSHEMGFEKFHMYMRPIQFEFATSRDNASKTRPPFVSDISDEDSAQLDRFVPNHLILALHELDETHFGRLHFRTKEGIMQFLKPGGIAGLQLLLKSQIVHKNALLAAVQLAYLCKSEMVDVTRKLGMESPGTKATQAADQSAAKHVVPHGRSSIQIARLPQAFVSLQIEKMFDRDIMLTDFSVKKEQFGMALKSPGELEKVKRFLISEFLQRFNTRMAQYSLRAQLIAYYKSILQLLTYFPSVRDTYFMLGEMNETKDSNDDLEGLTNSDHRVMRFRPRRLLSQDGKHLLNIWFIPHNLEILGMFKSQPDHTCNLALSFCVKIAGALHDILQYVCAQARMGSCSAHVGANKRTLDVSAQWGGTEGIASVLREIQSHLNNLSDPTSCQEVSEYLTLRRDVMFLEFESALRHSMVETFLSTGNVDAYKAITDNIHIALPSLSNVHRSSLAQIYLPIPEPYESYDPQAIYTFPWRGFLGNHGPFMLKHWHWHRIDYFMQLCMSGLNSNDRQVANGEILGISLLMEDVLAYNYKISFLTHLEIFGQKHAFDMDVMTPDPRLFEGGGSTANITAATDTAGGTPPKISHGSSRSDSKPASRAGSSSSRSTSRFGARSTTNRMPGATSRRTLSRSKDPLDSYRLLKAFLTLWKQLEILKDDWGRRKFNVEAMDTHYIYKEFLKSYRAEVYFPVMQSVARRLGCLDKYEGIAADDKVLVMPEGASEVEVRMRQMAALLEALEIHMIQEVRKKLARELSLVVAERQREEEALPTDLWKRPVSRLSLVVAERQREEEALPTDLWKRPVMKESYTIARPHIAEQFWTLLMTDGKVIATEDNVTFTKKHLMECMNLLSQKVLQREKHNYESYTMYYETMLRTHHTLLYSKEQEIKQINDQLRQLTHNNVVEVQCQMADHVHELLMEITALRARITELRDVTAKQEDTVRDKVKAEYHELTMNMFNMTFQLKGKFDEFRSDLYDDVLEKVNEARKEAVAGMHRVFERYGQSGVASDLLLAETNKMDQADKIRNLERENHLLNIMTLKMKSLAMWKQNQSSLKYTRMINELSEAAVISKKDYVEVKMLADEEVAQLKLQLAAIRKALSDVEMECNNVKQTFEKDMRMRAKHAHIENEKNKARKHLDEKRRENIEQLIDELDEKDKYLRTITDEQERTVHLRQINQSRNKRDVDLVKIQLNHEKNLKRDAFHRVDELRTQVHNFESRESTTAGSERPEQPRVWQMRAQSAVPTSIITKVLSNNGDKKLTRPKTTCGRMMSAHTNLIAPMSLDIEPVERIKRLDVQKYQQFLESSSS